MAVVPSVSGLRYTQADRRDQALDIAAAYASDLPPLTYLHALGYDCSTAKLIELTYGCQACISRGERPYLVPVTTSPNVYVARAHGGSRWLTPAGVASTRVHHLDFDCGEQAIAAHMGELAPTATTVKVDA